MPQSGNANRSPLVKAGRPPSDDEILAKADEMKARGLDGRTIAKEMRLEPGFENVATTAVRDLIKGRWKPAGRPNKKPHENPHTSPHMGNLLWFFRCPLIASVQSKPR